MSRNHVLDFSLKKNKVWHYFVQSKAIITPFYDIICLCKIYEMRKLIIIFFILRKLVKILFSLSTNSFFISSIFMANQRKRERERIFNIFFLKLHLKNNEILKFLRENKKSNYAQISNFVTLYLYILAFAYFKNQKTKYRIITYIYKLALKIFIFQSSFLLLNKIQLWLATRI